MTIVIILNFAITRPLHYYLHIFSHWYHPVKFFIILSQSNFEITVVLHYFKFQSFGFRNSNTLYYLLSPNIIVRPIVSRKCFYIFILLFLSGDIQLYSGSISLNQYVFSSLDVYESFSTPSVPKLRIATLNSRSVLNKSAIINNHILENKIDILCITETWINDGQFTNLLLSSLLPPNYILSQYYGRPHTSRGGGVAIINQKSVHHTFVSTPVFSTLECIGSVITSKNNSFKLLVVYRLPSSSMSSMSTFFTV